MTEYVNTAISLGDLKQTALYFDYVIPANYGFAAFVSILQQGDIAGVPLDEQSTESFIELLLPPKLRSSRQFKDILLSLRVPSLEVILERAQLQKGSQEVDLQRHKRLTAKVNKLLSSMISSFQLQDLPIDVAVSFIGDKPQRPNPMVSVASTSLVDVGRVEWPHILEFRKSESSRNALRRFRMFAFEKYEGRTRSYIEDDLAQRLEAYQSTVKEWGFETRRGAFTALLKSKLMGSALAGSFLATLFGEPIAALAAAAGGVVTEIAGIALEVRSREFGLARLARENPVAFIEMARNFAHEV